MTNIRKTLFTFAVAAAAPTAATFAVPFAVAPLHAQVYVTQSVPRAWLGITYDESIVIHNRDRTASVVITDVAKGSPAEKAGIVIGDTVVKVNDFRANTEVLRSMGASVEPGDTVRLVVRRAGRDRTIAIEVAKRPPNTYVQGKAGQSWTYSYNPDSVRGMMKIFVDSVYAGLDTARMRMFHFDSAGGFRNLITDSMFFGTMPMTVFQFPSNGDSLRHFLPSMRFPDSATAMMRFRAPGFDTTIYRVLPGVRGDSFMRALPRGNMIPPSELGDLMRPSDLVFRNIARSENSFAGADLTNVNPELGEYFGTKSGALVLSVPEGSPAERAGLEPGDIVLKVDGKSVANVAQLRRAVETARRGAPIKLEIMRHQKARTVELHRE